MNFVRFHVIAVGAGVADMWIRQGDDLAAIRWIGQDLLIARHRGIEDDFTDSLAFGTNGCAVKNRSIL